MALRRRQESASQEYIEIKDVVIEEDLEERYRRYGMRHHLEEKRDRYIIRVEFPRRVPGSARRQFPELPREMPDYEYSLELKSGELIVNARLTDPRFRDATDRTSSFPSVFEIRFQLADAMEPVEDRYEDKLLMITVARKPS